MHEPAAPRSPALRRTPVQQRSAERLDRILDACAALLGEVGYEALTTRAVAERAGVPIGSVYRFFGNKRDLADALGHRNLELFDARIARRLEPDRVTWRYVVDVMLDEYLAMKRTVPGFAVVDFTGNELVAGRLCALLVRHTALADGPGLRRVCLVAVQAVDSLLQLAFRDDPHGDPGLVGETRMLLHAYLEQGLGVG